VWVTEHRDIWPSVDLADLVRRGVDLRSFEVGDLICHTGTFTAVWESDPPGRYCDGPDRVPIDEAIAWARAHADVVIVRVGNGDFGGDNEGHFSAGARLAEHQMPVWPDGMKVAARPYGGPWKVWKDGFEA
jgi:hypothetical protein